MRESEVRSLEHLSNDYHIPSSFLDVFGASTIPIRSIVQGFLHRRTAERLVKDVHLAHTELARKAAPSHSLGERTAVHMVKNCLEGSIDGRVPLILGIWGAKGCGKSMNVELCCKRLGVAPIVVSAGELEDPWAGQPGKRLRERYRVAAEVMQTQGRVWHGATETGP